MSYQLGARSERNLVGVYPPIVQAVRMAITITEQDFCILDGGGLRTPAQAQQNLDNDTGVQNTLHLPQADGTSWAIDLVAWEHGKFTYGKNRAHRLRLYLPIRKAFLFCCDRIELLIQHGADWNLNGILFEPGEWDIAHFQRPVFPHRIEQARIALNERIMNYPVDPITSAWSETLWRNGFQDFKATFTGTKV